MTIHARITPYQKAAAVLATENDVPLQGERVRETDTGREKTGDGATHYNDLPYNDQVLKAAIGANTMPIVVDSTGVTSTTKRPRFVLDEFGEIDDILTEET